MRRSPFFAKLSLFFLIVIVLTGILADWIAPYNANEEKRTSAFHPPSKIHFKDEAGSFSRPYVYLTQALYDPNLRRVYKEDTSRKFFIRISFAKLFSLEQPASLFFLGTDSRGRDIFSRILYGTRVSLGIGFLGAFLAVGLGFMMGSLSGYFGGWTDQIIMRMAEFFMMIPGFYFLLALRSTLPPEMSSKMVFLLITVVLSLIGWGGIARVVRGMVLSLCEADFFQAARVLGRKDLEIVRRHVLPHTLPYFRVVFSVTIPAYILGESALSILGLGIQEPDVSWGNLLTDCLSVAHLKYHPWVIGPGIVIVLTSLCLNVLGDAFKEEEAYVLN